MIGDILFGITFYIFFGYIVLIMLDLLDSSLTHVLPTRGRRGYVTVPVFLWMAWPFAILLYILMVPVLMVKGIVYMLKGYKSWV